MEHRRAHIRLVRDNEVTTFVSWINGDGTATKYTLENFDGSHRVSARSLLGVMYFSADHNDDMYLVNETNDGEFPTWIDIFRV